MKTYIITVDNKEYHQTGRNPGHAVARLLSIPIKAIASTTRITKTNFCVSLFIKGKLTNFSVVRVDLWPGNVQCGGLRMVKCFQCDNEELITNREIEENICIYCMELNAKWDKEEREGKE